MTGVAHRQSLLHPTVRRMVVAGLLLLTVLAYAPGLHGEFQLDDWRTVESNLGIRALGDYLSPRLWLAALQSARALTDFSFALNYAVGGLNPFFYHVINLALHLVVVVLVYLLAREVLGLAGLSNRAGLVLAVTALFALHPLQSQAVVYVSQRAEELAAGFYLGALLLLLGAERRGVTWAGVWLYLAALAAFALSLASKSGGLTLPFAYLLLGILPERASYSVRLARPRRRLALAAPFALYAALVATMTLLGLKSAAPGLATAGFEVPRLSAGRYFLTQWHVIATYLRLLLWPAGQKPRLGLSPGRRRGRPGSYFVWSCALRSVGRSALPPPSLSFSRRRGRGSRARGCLRGAVVLPCHCPQLVNRTPGRCVDGTSALLAVMWHLSYARGRGGPPRRSAGYPAGTARGHGAAPAYLRWSLHSYLSARLALAFQDRALVGRGGQVAREGAGPPGTGKLISPGRPNPARPGPALDSAGPSPGRPGVASRRHPGKARQHLPCGGAQRRRPGGRPGWSGRVAGPQRSARHRGHGPPAAP